MLRRMLQRLWCRLMGHRWEATDSQGYAMECTRCHAHWHLNDGQY